MRTDSWRLTAEEVAAGLATDPTNGLGDAEARIRLEQTGRNEFAAAKVVPRWRRFLAQFQDVLVILLLIATAISVALWFYERDTSLPYEGLAILAIVLLNATMGFIQESRAEAALAALAKMSAQAASVIRDGERKRLPAAELVPGDLVLVEEGDTVPADIRLTGVTSLQAAEAALTGESLPVSKSTIRIDEDSLPLGDRDNMLFSGTSVTYGRGSGIVVATGMKSEMGRIAGMLEETPDETTPLQRELDRTGKTLGLVVVAIAIAMIATILIVEDVHGLGAIVDVLILGVALAVAAVPEGLPAIVTAVLSIGVQRMAKRKAIVRHLIAVETLGSASVIASDKTGTLTRNEMTVRKVITASGRVTFEGTGYAPEGAVTREDDGVIDETLHIELERALAVAERANNATIRKKDGSWIVEGDPTEGALIVAARKAGLSSQRLAERLPRVSEIPFSSERKLMSTVHRDTEQADRALVFAKGAPDVLLARSTRELVGAEPRALTTQRREEIRAANAELAGNALRTLGVAYRALPVADAHEAVRQSQPGLEDDLVFVGLIGMIDPPRDEAKAAVAEARRAGVRPVMITGDHPLTALVIAHELGISEDERSVTGAEIEQMDDATLVATVRDFSVYARVTPDHKLRLVKALQSNGEVVAMTGDGVNDAPALRTAAIGVAMGITGTDVAKQAADIVLADDNFATIVAAVEEGRGIFDNIRKFLRFLLSSNIGEVMTMFFGVLLARQLGIPSGESLVLPLVATQILWVNLVTDGAPALALGVDQREEGLMNRPPRPASERVITARMWGGIVIAGIVMAASTLAALDASMPGGFIEGSGTLRYGQSMAFTTLVLTQLFNVFNSRSDERSAFSHLFANRWLWASIGLSLALQFLVLYLPPLQRAFQTQPLSAADWVRCAVAASVVLWISEIAKVIRRRRQ
jgi:P-type Ca2+ transporter type 2C